MMRLNLTLGSKTIKTEIKPMGSPLPIKMEAAIPIVQGSPFETYVHDQMVASDIWHIDHNLKCYPAVSVVDTGGNIVVGEVKYISENQIIVTFSHTFSGKAYIN